ncbi:unnamed protein product [Diamesa serratosioi]
MKFPWTTSITDVLKNDTKIDEKLQHIVKDLTHHKGDISKVVEELGPALTNKETEMRLKGMKFLSDILKTLPEELLNATQLSFITTFYCDRMKDHHSIAPQVINGLLAIVKMQQLPRDLPITILQHLFQNIPCQSQLRGDRANIFLIIQRLADNYEPEMTAMGADFIYGVINAMDGERDPRNLLFLFKYMPKFMASYSLRHLSEEMFEVFSCYFPIDFHPSQNDPEAITRDLLAEKLSQCLCSSKDFAESCTTLALEKLDSDLKVAKLDSLQLLIVGTKTFPSTSTVIHFDEIWQAIKMEFLPGTGTKEVVQKALSVIVGILQQLNDDEANLTIILDKIFTNVIGTLLNRDSGLFKSTMELVMACGSACDMSCMYVAKKLLPITVTDLKSHEELKECEKIDIFEDLNKCLVLLESKKLLTMLLNDSCLVFIQKELIKILTTPVGLQLPRVAFKVLASMASVVTEENRFIIYQKLSENLSKANDEDIQCLQAFSKYHENEVLTLVLKQFIQKTYTNALEVRKLFESISQLISLPFFRDHVLEFLCLNLFNNPAESVQLLVLEVLTNILLDDAKKMELTKILFEEWKIVVKLIDLIKNESIEDTDVLYSASIVMSLVVKTLTIEQQTTLIEKYLPELHLNDSIRDLYVTSGLLGFLDQNIALENHFEQLANDLTKLSLNTKDEKVRRIANNLLCSMFNKAPIDDKHKKILKKIYELLKEEIKKHNHQAVELLGWLAKGLLSRGHPDAAELLQTLAELLDHPKLSTAAALAFEIISLEYPNLHLPVLKHLFKQKIFVLAMKFLESKIEKFSEHHLTAMAHVLQITPHQVLKMNLEKVGPILFKCIQLETPHPKAIFLSLKIINQFILDKSQYMCDHLQHLVKQLLALTTFKGYLEVRIFALTCLKNLTIYPLFALVPYKGEVCLELEAALDDHKRLVRAAAVATRMAWYFLGDEEAKK